MKLITDNLGKFIVGAVVAVLVLTLTASVLLPNIRNFISNVFVDETNYLHNDSEQSGLTLSATSDAVELTLGADPHSIFDSITAVSATGVDLKSQLTVDYAKAVAARKQVFVYQIAADKTNVLAKEIDTSTAGEWVVCYLIKDGTDSKYIEVSYIVK